MGLFRESNTQFRWTMAAAFLVCSAYIGAFVIIRLRETSEECGLNRVDFPRGNLRTVYRPLIGFDRYLNYNVVYEGEIDEARFGNNYFCGE